MIKKLSSLLFVGALFSGFLNAQGQVDDPFANQQQNPAAGGRAIFKFKVEIYSVKKEDYVADRDAVQALIKSGKASLISGGETQFPSGQRSKIESTKEVIYAAAGDSSGLEFETRNVGCTIEVDAVLGGDGITADLSYSISHSTAAPELQWRKIPVGGDLFVEDPKFSTKNLTSSSSLWVSDKWKLLGIMPEVTAEAAQAQEFVYPVFVQLQKSSDL